MRKIFFISSAFLLSGLLSLSVYAANGQGAGSQSGSNSQGANLTTGSGNTQPVQNQNQVQTQNQGEEQQLNVNTQEKEGTETGKGANSNSLNSSMGSVAQQVQKLLQTQSAAGGIGDQVREWAKSQNQSQQKIQEHLANVDSKAGMFRALFGPDYKSLGELTKEMEQNKVRVKQLEQLSLKMTNESDITNIQEMITLLQQENTDLQELITSEESSGGLFGWLVKLFVD